MTSFPSAHRRSDTNWETTLERTILPAEVTLVETMPTEVRSDEVVLTGDIEVQRAVRALKNVFSGVMGDG